MGDLDETPLMNFVRTHLKPKEWATLRELVYTSHALKLYPHEEHPHLRAGSLERDAISRKLYGPERIGDVKELLERINGAYGHFVMMHKLMEKQKRKPPEWLGANIRSGLRVAAKLQDLLNREGLM